MVGHKMYQILSREFEEVFITIRSLDNLEKKKLFEKNKIIQIDLINYYLLEKIIQKIKPNYIINCVGITIRRGINDNILNSILLNSVLPNYLKNLTFKYNFKLIHFSTDCVFSGNSDLYYCDSITDASDTYGKTKAMGEVTSANCLTLRGSMIGREIANKTELLEWFLSNPNSSSVKGFCNVYYSGITTFRMAKYVLKIIQNNIDISGIYNVSSKPISKFDLLKLFSIYFEKNITIKRNNKYSSKKILDSERFYKKIDEIIPNWKIDLIDELVWDSNLNNKYYS